MPWRKINNMPSVFAEQIKGKPLGFVSEIIKTGSGFHILKLEEKRGPLVKFEEQWETRHVLLTPSAIRDVDATKAEAELLRERVVNGESFIEIAKPFLRIRGQVLMEGVSTGFQWEPQFQSLKR